MSTGTHVLRIPNDPGSHKNGYILGYTEPENITDKRSREVALDAHRRAMFILDYKKRPVPSLEEMKAEIDESNQLANIKKTIETVKKDHVEDIQKLYAYQADEYHRERVDRYLSNDESWYQEDHVNDESSVKLRELLYTGPYKDALVEAQWQNDLEYLRYAHVSRLNTLHTERRKFEQKQEEERKAWEKAFPLNEEDFRKKGRDVQLRTARFLVASSEAEKGKILTTYGWDWRQVAPLETLFQRDERFNAEIRGMVLSDTTFDPRRPRP